MLRNFDTVFIGYKFHTVTHSEQRILIIPYGYGIFRDHPFGHIPWLVTVNCFMQDIGIYYRGVFSPVLIEFKECKSARTVHIVLYHAERNRLFGHHSFSISVTPSGIVLSTVIS